MNILKKNLLKLRIVEALCVLAAITLAFIINNIFLFSTLDQFGIQPRVFSFSSILGIFVSWLLHSNWNHFYSNMVSFIPLLLFLFLLDEKPKITFSTLVLLSGITTWLFGSPNSIHIGVSGVIFAIFGYFISSLFVRRKLIFLLPLILAVITYGSQYYFSFINGLIPKEGISFIAHFGGLISGLVLPYIYLKIDR